MPQPLGLAGKRKPGGVQGLLLQRSGDDGVHLVAHREPHRALDRVSRDLPRAEDPGPIGGAPLLPRGPAPYRYPLVGGDLRDLLRRADDGDLGVDRCAERFRRDLRPHAAGIAEGHGEAGPHVHPGRSSTRVARRSRSM